MRRPIDFYFRLDLRSLGALRILYALLLIHDWFSRWPHIEAFYTSAGIWPIEAPLPRTGEPFHFSLLDPLTSVLAVRLAFVAGLACYVLFLVGWRTRIAHILSFLFFASLRTRNPLLMHGGDTVLVTMLLWSIFLPLGARFSVDALGAAVRRGVSLRDRRPQGSRPELSAPSVAALAIVIQFGLVYLATAAAKTGPSWRDGTAVYYTLQLDLFTNGLGQWLGDALPLFAVRLLTYGTHAFEWAAMPLFLLPFGQPHARRLAIVGLASFHLGTLFMLTIGSFPLVMIASMVVLLRDQDWALLGRWADRGTRPVIAVFDDTCGFCQRCCQVLALADRAARIRFVGASEREKLPLGITDDELQASFVATEADGSGKKLRAPAVAALANALPLPWRWLRLVAVPGIRPLADRVYDWVAANRYRFSERMGFTACGIDVVPDARRRTAADAPRRRRPLRLVVDAAAAFLLVTVLIDSYNLTFASRLGTAPARTPVWSRAPILAFDLVQGWRMFAPDPFRGDGFWVIDGRGAGDGHTDLLTWKPVAWDKPARLGHRYDQYWRMYLISISQPRYRAWRIWYARWLARQAAKRGVPPPPLAAFEYWYVQEDTRPPGTPKPWPAQRFRLWGYDATNDALMPGSDGGRP